MEPNPEQVRWRWVTREIPRKKAKLWRYEEIKCLRTRIEELQDKLAALRASPLVTERRVREMVSPGEPGWEEADDVFVPEGYAGSFTWVARMADGEEDAP